MNKSCFFLTYDAYGDWYSVNGLIRYLRTKYSKIYLVVDYSSTLKKYATYDFVSSLFYDDKNIFVIKKKYFNFLIKIPLLNFEIIDSRFNENNKIYTFLKVFNKNYPLGNIQCISNNNSNMFYESLGVNSKIKFEYFDIPQVFFKEDQKMDKILICEAFQNQINRRYFSNDKDFINLHNKFSNPLSIIPLVKNCKEIHLIENSIALLIYLLNYKKVISPTKVFLHLYARENETLRYPNQKIKDTFFNMFLEPKLLNWEYIYEKI